MRLLVLGADGQLGRELSELLSKGEAGPFTLPGAFIGADVRLVDIDTLDIVSAKATRAYFEEFAPDLVINCAAYTNVDGCETNRDTAFLANAVGARSVAEASCAVGAQLVHISTDYVFPGTGNTPYAEWDATGPTSVYGKSKLLGESYAREACSRTYIIRTAWLYGRHGKNFVKTIIRVAKEKGKLTVVNDQLGNPTNALDLAYHILKIALCGRYGVYHVTGNGVCSWYEFALEIIRLADIDCEVVPCRTEDYASPAKRPAFSALGHMALSASVGDEMRPWKEALEDFILSGGHEA